MLFFISNFVLLDSQTLLVFIVMYCYLLEAIHWSQRCCCLEAHWEHGLVFSFVFLLLDCSFLSIIFLFFFFCFLSLTWPLCSTSRGWGSHFTHWLPLITSARAGCSSWTWCTWWTARVSQPLWQVGTSFFAYFFVFFLLWWQVGSWGSWWGVLTWVPPRMTGSSASTSTGLLGMLPIPGPIFFV